MFYRKNILTDIAMNDFPKEMKIDIKVDDQEAAGRFSNFANVFHSAEEFILDFLFVNPAPPPGFGKLMSRVIMTPAHAKRLLVMLQENVRNYEEHFGEIQVHQQPPEMKNIQ